MKVVFHSTGGNVRRFVKKAGFSNTFEIDFIDPFEEVNEPFVLIVATYEPEITDVYRDFLETNNNETNCKGVIGSGNYNFGNDMFCYSARDIAKEYDLPWLANFENAGMGQEVEDIKQVIEGIEVVAE